MARYLFIESRSPWESRGVSDVYALAAELGAQGHEVTLFLVQNGVMAARRGAQGTGVPGRIQVIADDFSLRERSIPVSALAPGVAAGTIDVVVDLLADGARAVWH
jgi:hypothetical protein